MGIVLGTLFWGGRDFWGSLPGGSRGWRQHLNGSLAHTRRLVVLVCLGVCQGQIGPDPVLLLWPLEICSHSLTFLGLDLALGASFPSGIHCLGHLLKGLMSEISTMPVLASPRGWPALRSAAMMHLQPIWATGPLLAFRRSGYDQLLIHHHPARSGGLGPTALVGGTVDGADSFVSL